MTNFNWGSKDLNLEEALILALEALDNRDDGIFRLEEVKFLRTHIPDGQARRGDLRRTCYSIVMRWSTVLIGGPASYADDPSHISPMLQDKRQWKAEVIEAYRTALQIENN